MKKDFIKECMLDKNNIIIKTIGLEADNLIIYASKTGKIHTMIGQYWVNDTIKGIKL